MIEPRRPACAFAPLPLDVADRAILSLLQDNARLTNRELSEYTGVSARACARRVHRLEEAGIISSYRAMIDPATLGFRVTAFVRVTLAGPPGAGWVALQAAIGQWQEVTECHLLSGDREYLLRIVARSMPDYDTLLRTLREVRCVTRVRANLSLMRLVSPGLPMAE